MGLDQPNLQPRPGEGEHAQRPEGASIGSIPTNAEDIADLLMQTGGTDPNFGEEATVSEDSEQAPAEFAVEEDEPVRTVEEQQENPVVKAIERNADRILDLLEAGATQDVNPNVATRLISFIDKYPDIFEKSALGPNGKVNITLKEGGAERLKQLVKENIAKASTEGLDEDDDTNDIQKLQKFLETPTEAPIEQTKPETPSAPEDTVNQAIKNLTEKVNDKFESTNQPNDIYMIEPSDLPDIETTKNMDDFYTKFGVLLESVKNLHPDAHVGSFNAEVAAPSADNPEDWKELTRLYKLLDSQSDKELAKAGITLGDPMIRKSGGALGQNYNFGIMYSVDKQKLNEYLASIDQTPELTDSGSRPRSSRTGEQLPSGANRNPIKIPDFGPELAQAEVQPKPLIKRLNDADGNPLPTQADFEGRPPTPAGEPDHLADDEDYNSAFTPEETEAFLRPVAQANRPREATADEIEAYRASIINAAPETPAATPINKMNFKDILLPTSPEAFDQLANQVRQLEEKRDVITRSIARNPILKSVSAINSRYQEIQNIRQSRINTGTDVQPLTSQEIQLANLINTIAKEESVDINKRLQKFVAELEGNLDLLTQIGFTNEQALDAVDQLRNQQRELQKIAPDLEQAQKAFEDLREARTSDTKMEAYLNKTRRKAKEVLRKRYDQLKAENPGLDLKKEVDVLRLQNMLQDEVFSTTEFVNGATFNEAEFRNMVNDILPVATPDRRAQLVDNAVSARQAAEKDGKAKGLKGDELSTFIDLRVDNALATLEPTLRADIKQEALTKIEKNLKEQNKKSRLDLRQKANKKRTEFLLIDPNLESGDEGKLEAKIIAALQEDPDLKALFDSGEAAQIIREGIVGRSDRNRYIRDRLQRYKDSNIQNIADPRERAMAIESTMQDLLKEGYSQEEIQNLIELSTDRLFTIPEFNQYKQKLDKKTGRFELTHEDIWKASIQGPLDAEAKKVWAEIEASKPGKLEAWGNWFNMWYKKIIRLPGGRAWLMGMLTAGAGVGVALFPGGALPVLITMGVGAGWTGEEFLRLNLTKGKKIRELRSRINELEFDIETYDSISQGGEMEKIQDLYFDAVAYAKGDPLPSTISIDRKKSPKIRANTAQYRERMVVLQTIADQFKFQYGQGEVGKVEEATKALMTNYRNNINTLTAMARTYINQQSSTPITRGTPLAA